MKVRHRWSLPIITILYATGPGLMTGAAQVSSTFDVDVEGWIASGDIASPVTWSPTDGNPDGSVSVVDSVSGGVMYFVAPAKFLGNHADAYGKSLKFDLKQIITGSPSQFDADDVRLSGAGLTLAFDTPANPDVNGAWTSFIVPLSEAGWHVGSIGGAPATQAQMQSVLAAITALHIRAEYKTGADTDFIDNVILEGDTLFSTIDNACGSDLPAGLFPTGTLEPLSLISLTLVGAQPNAQAVLMLGVQQASLMRLGCSLVFVPDVSVPGTTDANGSQELIGRWPSGLPSGFTIFAQTFILAASLPKGFQTTNTVVMTAP